MNLRRRIALVAALVLATTSRGARAVDAPPAAGTDDVADLARGLEATSAAARARAAEALGGRYPEAALAVPVLLDAVGDEDAQVRRAAVSALRRLGRAGQEEAAAAWTTMGARGLAHHGTVFEMIGMLGAATTTTDLVVAFLEACAEGKDWIPDAMLGLAVRPWRSPEDDFVSSVQGRDRLGLVAVAWPWLLSTDGPTAKRAAAVVTVLGRSAVSDVDPDVPAGDDTASSPALVSMLSAPHPVVRHAGWRLLSLAAPHSPSGAAAILAAAKLLPADGAERGSGAGRDAPRPLSRAAARPALLGLGSAARPLLDLTPTHGPMDGASIATLLAAGAEEEARAAWDEFVDEWTSEAGDRRAPRRWLPRAASVVFAFAQDAAMATHASRSLARLLDAERERSAGARALLAPVDPSAPADPVPIDPRRSPADELGATLAEPCLALAWLAHRSPGTGAGDALRVRTAAALRRALVWPGKVEDRLLAATVVADLGLPRLVPPATLVASLAAEGTRRDRELETAVLRALAAVGDIPPAAVARLAAFAAGPAASDFAPQPEDRERFAAGWPHVVAALERGTLGRSADLSTTNRLLALDALGRVTGDRSEAAAIVATRTADPDARVRYRAARALRRLRS